MNDTVKRLMELADEYRNAGPARVGQCAKELEAELTRLFTPLSEEQCNHCNGTGRMVRDPDIGTDQECFVCDGSGITGGAE